MTELWMQGYMINGELHVREADCRRAVSDALRTGKEALIQSHDKLLDLLRDCVSVLRGDVSGPAQVQAVIREAEDTIANATRAS